MFVPRSLAGLFCPWLFAVLLLLGLGAPARAQDAEGEPTPPPQEAIEAYESARAHYKAGRYPAAIKELERALRLDPDSPDLAYNVARVYELMGKLDQAVTYYRRYRTMLSPDDTQERERIRETIERLRGAQRYVESEAEAPKAPSPPTRPAPEMKRGVADGAFWTFATLTMAGLAGGGVTGGLALKREAEVQDYVLGEDGSIADRDALSRQADRMALSSDVLLGAGAGMALTALLLYVLRERPVETRKGSPEGLEITPRWGAHGGTLFVGGRF